MFEFQSDVLFFVSSSSTSIRDLEMAGCNGDSSASLIEQQEQMVIEKKFGGIAPKKLLISKDRKRAYFDSADWVLDKLQTTVHRQQQQWNP
ncbi:hypothetical protein BRADI_1g17050v3 [Brachypodium distachyon]|uniref:Negatively light-regulated protein n=1 Tax=Brachypodium distachyon TaxID=15368 RepID=A0A0Q3JR60_BRADI|nr:hypothetical protein BRADI_1g17050v3 [Brachypodium distachyon]